MAETLRKIPEWYRNFIVFSSWNDCQDHCSLWSWLGFVTCWAVQSWSFRDETTMIRCLYPRNDSVMLSASPCHNHSCSIILDLDIKLSVVVVQSLSRVQLFATNPVDCSTPGSRVLRCLPEFTQIHAHWCHVGDAIQPSHPLPSPSPASLTLSRHQGLSQGVSSSHQVARVLELQLQHQSFRWIFRVGFL